MRISLLAAYSLLCGIFISIGLMFCVIGLPYIMNKVHKNISVIRDFYFDKIPAWIHIKLETKDAFVANNPINVSVKTTPINLDEIRELQLEFEGADKYFPSELEPPPSPPPVGSTKEEYEQYWKEMEEYWRNFEKYLNKTFEQISANILHLQSDKKISDFELPKDFPISKNYSIPKYSTFSGSLQNLTYSSGGKFDIGITIIKADGSVIGYGVGDLSYVLKDAIEISPPEVSLQIKNSNIMTGLAWIGVGLPFLVAGLTGLLDIIKHFTFR